MERFSELFRKIDKTTSTLAKVHALKQYFLEEKPDNAVWAMYLLLGKRRKRDVTSRTLRETLATFSDLPEWLLKECYSHVGDTAETVALLLKNTQRANESPTVELHEWLEERIPKLSQFDDQTRSERIVHWWTRLHGSQVFILNKIMTGGFRVGVSQKLIIRALSQAFDVPEPVLIHRLMGTWKPEGEFFTKLITKNIGEMHPSTPYPFFLASPLEDEQKILSDLDRWQVEWKWDGIRAQVIKREGNLYIWSRGEDLVTGQFPDLFSNLSHLPDGSVIDGEIVAWGVNRPLSFNHLQRRLGRKTVQRKDTQHTPVHFIAYDLLELRGEDMRKKPLQERAAKLSTLLSLMNFTRVHCSEALVCTTWKEIEALRSEARERGVEGLMIKDRMSAYGTGRKKGAWWKYKVDPLSLDAVLMYAQPGSGKRANLFTDYTFGLWKEDRLVPFAKAYSGLSNAEIERLDRWIRRNTVERFGPVRLVQPHHVFEIGFDGIAKSTRHKSGVAARFPRILRWRTDKRPEEADNLETALNLIE